MATSRPPISRVISAASALSHSMVSSFVFEQRRRQAAEFGVVLDDQYGSPCSAFRVNTFAACTCLGALQRLDPLGTGPGNPSGEP
jgi:hypothetical protein